jgi:UDP-2,3-diacylglucosamine pyrophosphatase LpxH
MTRIEETAVWSQFNIYSEKWHEIAHAQLDKAFQLSPHLTFDENSRLIFISDAHRGVGNRDDMFAPNANLFLHALTHYLNQEYTFVEVGDGDELWHNRYFKNIRLTYSKVFDLFAQFRKRNKLHLIVGNHDSPKGLFDPMEKDGIPVYQGLRMTYVPTGQKLFAVHGHQADPDGDKKWDTYRRRSRYFMKYLLRLGIDKFYHFAEPKPGLPEPVRLKRLPRRFGEKALTKAYQLESAIQMWLVKERQIVISGHTHMLNFPRQNELPHFNTGHCITPGYITGLEIDRGILSMVKWMKRDDGFSRTMLRQMPLNQILFNHTWY